MHILKNIPRKQHGKEDYQQKYIDTYNFIVSYEDGREEPGESKKITNSVKFIEDVFCVDFPRGSLIGCVYMIGTFYIGYTGDLRARLMNHARMCINEKHFNKELQDKFVKCLKFGIKMPVTILSYDRREEDSLIKRYSEIYELCNINGNPKK